MHRTLLTLLFLSRLQASAMLKSRFSLNCGDAVEWLRSLDDDSADLVITDPSHRGQKSSGYWFETFPDTRLPELLAEIHRVLRENRHFYLSCRAETMFVAKPMAEAAGFKFWRPLVWDKGTTEMGYHYRPRCGYILFFEKGRRMLNDMSVPDVLEADRVHSNCPTERAVVLSEILIRQSTQLGEVVLDPFCGTGSTGIAAAKLGRGFVGNDWSTEALAIAERRILDASFIAREN